MSSTFQSNPPRVVIGIGLLIKIKDSQPKIAEPRKMSQVLGRVLKVC